LTERARLAVEPVNGSGSTHGEEAERLVVERLRAALPATAAILPNVRWLARDHGYVREGEADVVIGEPDRGILVLEVKSGEVRRDGTGTWWVGRKELPRSPFRQAADSRHALVRKLQELPGWTVGLRPIAGEAVAFPDVELDSMRGRLGLLGPDVDAELIADQSMFVDTESGRRELGDFVARAFEAWSGQSGTQPPGRAAIDLLVATMTEAFEIRPMLRNEIAGGEVEVVKLTEGQFHLLHVLRGVRRASIVGGAGTGKTMLAAEKARRLAREGFRTLLVCFNSALAGMLAEEVGDVARETGRLDVKTFHQLCEDLGREAGVLPQRPVPIPQDWWDETLPRALDEAAAKLEPRYHAIVVDEGQDFDDGWLLSLEGLLFDGREDVMYVFHDPAQAIYRDDSVAGLGMTEYPLDLNCRNAQPIHDVVRRFAGEGLASGALREDGRAPEFIEAGIGEATIRALRGVLHRLRVDEGVKPWDIAVLTGARLDESAVWAVSGHRFGNEVLGNAAVDDAGHNLGLAAHLVPPLPTDVILCETIRRFKGLERPVIVLVELPEEDATKLDRLLYVGASRARQHLIVIGSPAVLGRLR
jgi:UvrD-like helicase C-terminal domain/Nuclease-related domain/AAA domain